MATPLRVDRTTLWAREPEFAGFFRDFPEVSHFILYSTAEGLEDVEFWFVDSSHPWGIQELIAGTPLRVALEHLFPAV